MESIIGGLVLDGADQQGKSTLAEKIQEKVNMPILHFSIPDENTNFETEYIKDIAKHNEQPIIFDRSYVSEMVYGDIFRGGSKVTPEIKKYVETILNGHNYIFVLCKRKNYQWKDRDEDYTKDDNVKVMEKYDEVYDSINLPKIIVDPFDNDADQQVVDFWLKNNEGVDVRS